MHTMVTMLLHWDRPINVNVDRRLSDRQRSRVWLEAALKFLRLSTCKHTAAPLVRTIQSALIWSLVLFAALVISAANSTGRQRYHWNLLLLTRHKQRSSLLLRHLQDVAWTVCTVLCWKRLETWDEKAYAFWTCTGKLHRLKWNILWLDRFQ